MKLSTYKWSCLCAAIALVCTALPLQAANVCATASLVNPATLAPGIGGTGMLTLRPGIGGTGIEDGGIGGTGIAGVITGFASICVNGIEVHYDQDTPVDEDGSPGSLAGLAVGQVVTVNAQGKGDELKARRIALTHMVIGPVESVDTSRNVFKVLGQEVHADTNALPRIGQWVRVSGLRQQDGTIAVSRLQTIAAQAQVQLVGTLDLVNGNAMAIGGAMIKLQAGTVMADAKALRPGSELLVRGAWRDGQLVAQRIESEPTRKNLGAVERVVLEGFVRSSSAQTIDIGQGPMALGQHLKGMDGDHRSLAANQRVRVIAAVSKDREISVERIEVREQRSGRSGRSDSNKSRSGRDDSSRDERIDDKRSGEDSSGSGSTSGKTSKQEDSGSTRSGSSGSSGSSESKSGSRSGSSSGSSDSRSGSSSGGSGSGSGKGK